MMWLNDALMCYMRYGMMWKCDQDIVFSGKEILCSDFVRVYWFVRSVMRHHDSTDIMESHRWSYSVGKSRGGSYDFVCGLKYNW